MKKEISHIGSLWTISDFRQSDGSIVRIKVRLSSTCTIANQITSYEYSLYVKGYRCRNFVLKYSSDRPLDERIVDYLSEQELYEAFYNHWIKLNPFRMFSNSQTNSVLGSFRVTEIKLNTEHLAF